MSTQTLTTIEQFVQMSNDGPGDFELVQGEVIPVPSPIPIHSWIRDRLLIRLSIYLDSNKLGFVLAETDCRTGDDSVRRPDLAFFTAEHWQLIDLNRIPLPIAPDLAVEVLSPSEAAVEVNRKVLEYLAAGSREVWVIDWKNREVLVRAGSAIRILGAGDALESPLLPGLSILVADVLQNP